MGNIRYLAVVGVSTGRFQGLTFNFKANAWLGLLSRQP